MGRAAAALIDPIQEVDNGLESPVAGKALDLTVAERSHPLLNLIWPRRWHTVLGPFEKDYKWPSQVYRSVQPSSGHGKLIWHSLGAKTIELIHQKVHVDAVRDDLDTLVLDPDLLEAVLSNPDPKKSKEIEIKLLRRLRGHGGKPAKPNSLRAKGPKLPTEFLFSTPS